MIVSLPLWLAIIAAIPPTLLAFAALVQSWHNGNKLQQVSLNIDGRLEQLLASTNAKGRQDERDQQASDGNVIKVDALKKANALLLDAVNKANALLLKDANKADALLLKDANKADILLDKKS